MAYQQTRNKRFFLLNTTWTRARRPGPTITGARCRAARPCRSLRAAQRGVVGLPMVAAQSAPVAPREQTPVVAPPHVVDGTVSAIGEPEGSLMSCLHLVAKAPWGPRHDLSRFMRYEMRRPALRSHDGLRGWCGESAPRAYACGAACGEAAGRPWGCGGGEWWQAGHGKPEAHVGGTRGVGQVWLSGQHLVAIVSNYDSGVADGTVDPVALLAVLEGQLAPSSRTSRGQDPRVRQSSLC